MIAKLLLVLAMPGAVLVGGKMMQSDGGDAGDRARPEPTPDAELVPVLATGDPGVIAVAKSLLDGDGIDYFVRGEGLQDLFGLGRVTGFSYVVGPAEFWVRADAAARARVLLEDLIARERECE